MGFIFTSFGFAVKLYQIVFDTFIRKGLLLFGLEDKWISIQISNDVAEDFDHRFSKSDLLKSLLAVERQAKREGVKTDLRIGIGFGACRDLFVRAIDFFHMFGFENEAEKMTHYNHIDSREEFEEMFLFYFTKGVAAEYVFVYFFID